ncbi:MAG: GTP cyclohydrolase II [Candidatus Micrarchaeia archaeon]|jgi:3,4-dihydroxy 2-butanone 4-phosphate synthase/GTP cyclohydrolase II
MAFSTVGGILADVRRGKPVIVVDDESRENEGDVFIAAQKASVSSIAFMIREARGLFCVPLTARRLDELGLDFLGAAGLGDALASPFTMSVDAAAGTTTGMSASDRLATVRALLSGGPRGLKRPGHVFPLRAHELGVLGRRGHTEAAVDLARLAGLAPGGVICEIINADGSMARLPDLKKFARRHGLKMVSVGAIAEYLHGLGGIAKAGNPKKPPGVGVRRGAQARLPTRFGDFSAIAFESGDVSHAYLALVKGSVRGKENVLVRVHSECLTGDALFSRRCDCGAQLKKSLELISKEGGVLVYSRQEGRGIGLFNKIAAYALQDKGLDTVEANNKLGFTADLRKYDVCAGILQNLGVRSVRLLTNNPRKVEGLKKGGVKVLGRVPLQTVPTEDDEKYLRVKKRKLGHLLDV